MARVACPLLYQINTRVFLREVSRTRVDAATLDVFDDTFLDDLAKKGFDWLWPLGVWRTGERSRAVSRTNEAWIEEARQMLPDLNEEDVCGSPFAIQEYTVREEYGGDEALARLRMRLHDRDMRLLVDFVPNHVGLDHPWISDHPEYLVSGDASQLEREPRNYVRLASNGVERIFAYGRDPYFDGWPDTVQLNYRHGGLRRAMAAELMSVADRADGVRCDMAMLLLPEVFETTWGDRSLPADGSDPVDTSFWSEVIPAIRARHPDFVLMAEVYWDLEYALQREGFDYTYDKRHYDRLRDQNSSGVRGHLNADAAFQYRSARFLENHDEPRCAAAFAYETIPAAAIATYLVPGLRFFHEGQFEGRRVRVPMHIGRRPGEPEDAALLSFYSRLLDLLQTRDELGDGTFANLEPAPAWEGNRSNESFLSFVWSNATGRKTLVCVNFAPTRGQCFVRLPIPGLEARDVTLRDLIGDDVFVRSGDELIGRGLYLDMAPWAFHVFDVATSLE